MSTKDTESNKGKLSEKHKDALPPPPAEGDVSERAKKITGLDHLKVENRRIKFVFSILTLLFLNYIVLLSKHSDSWGGWVVIGLLEIFLLLFLGMILEIKILNELLDKIIAAISGNSKENEDDNPRGN